MSVFQAQQISIFYSSTLDQVHYCSFWKHQILQLNYCYRSQIADVGSFLAVVRNITSCILMYTAVDYDADYHNAARTAVK